MGSLRSIGFALPVTSILAFCGCGDGLNMVEVEGTVTMEGKPLDQIRVEFWPLGEGLRSVGVTDEAGRFSLTTDDGERKGAVVGSHRIVLNDTTVLGNQFLGRAGENVDMSQGRKSRILGDYASAQRTPLTKDVVAGKKNEITLEVDPPK